MTFVPPGDRLNPYKLGATGTLIDGWQLKVNSVILNAAAEVEPLNGPPPAGDQFTLVNVSMTYTGAGSDKYAGFVFWWIRAVSYWNVPYFPACIAPPLDLGAYSKTLVPSGQTVTGNFCFVIDSSDASTLTLRSYTMVNAIQTPLYFALR